MSVNRVLHGEQRPFSYSALRSTVSGVKWRPQTSPLAETMTARPCPAWSQCRHLPADPGKPREVASSFIPGVYTDRHQGCVVSSWRHEWSPRFKYTPTHTALYLDPYLLSQIRNKKLRIVFLHFIFSEVIFNSLYHKGLSPRAEEDVTLCPEAVRERRSRWLPSGGRGRSQPVLPAAFCAGQKREGRGERGLHCALPAWQLPQGQERGCWPHQTSAPGRSGSSPLSWALPLTGFPVPPRS